MRNTLIALTLGLYSLPSLATTLAEQFTLMEKGADSALDTRLFSHDGVDIKAWVDGTPVIRDVIFQRTATSAPCAATTSRKALAMVLVSVRSVMEVMTAVRNPLGRWA